MAITSIKVIKDEAAQFRGIFKNVAEYRATYDPSSVGSNATISDDIAAPGASMGDLVLVSVDIDLANLTLTAQVSATDVVTLTLANTSAGSVDLAASNVHIICLTPYPV